MARRGPLYTDSDLYKWMEAVGFALQSHDDPALRATMDRLIDDVLSAQEPSGYLNTYWVEDRKALRFTELVRSHEEYCLGHLLQAGIAYFRATGNRRLLDGGIRMADYFVDNFGPTKRPMFTGHPELELAMVELYRTTGERKYLEFRRIPAERRRSRAAEALRPRCALHVQRHCRSRHARCSKGTPSAPCTPLRARPTTTWRRATPRTARRSSACGATSRRARCT